MNITKLPNETVLYNGVSFEMFDYVALGLNIRYKLQIYFYFACIKSYLNSTAVLWDMIKKAIGNAVSWFYIYRYEYVEMNLADVKTSGLGPAQLNMMIINEVRYNNFFW